MVCFRIINAKISVIPFARAIDVCFVEIPYINHKRTPIVNIRYMLSEIPEVFLVFITLIACGKKESVVKIAAIKPKLVIIMIPLKTLLFMYSFSITDSKDI